MNDTTQDFHLLATSGEGWRSTLPLHCTLTQARDFAAAYECTVFDVATVELLDASGHTLDADAITCAYPPPERI